MTRDQRSKVKDFLLKTSADILSRRKKRSLAELRQAMPFHLLFFGDQGIIAASEQRSIVTSMGQVLYPGLARVISELRYKKVVLGRKRADTAIKGRIPESQCQAIDNVLSGLYAGQRQPNHVEEMREILSTKTGNLREVEVLPDLHIEDFSPGPIFVELKSPISNLDVSVESKRKILTYLAIMDSAGIKNAGAFLGFTYNPYVRREDFKHWPVLKIMDMERQVLIGPELWDKLGGDGTFSDIVELVQEVRTEIVKLLPKR